MVVQHLKSFRVPTQFFVICRQVSQIIYHFIESKQNFLFYFRYYRDYLCQATNRLGTSQRVSNYEQSSISPSSTSRQSSISSILLSKVTNQLNQVLKLLKAGKPGPIQQVVLEMMTATSLRCSFLSFYQQLLNVNKLIPNILIINKFK